MPGRTLAIGDIHGCDTALETMLAKLQPTADDTVIVLGDVVDRGPNTKRCVEQLLALQDDCKLVILMGNHEEMMLDSIEGGSWKTSWYHYGGQEAVDSYGSVRKIPIRHLEFIRDFKDYYETHSTICVHANLQPGVALRRQTAGWLRWNHLSGCEQPHPTGKNIVCGHTRLANGVPAILNGWVCIDTAACSGGFLTCLDVDDLIVYQTNEAGEFKDGVPLGDIAEYFRPRR